MNRANQPLQAPLTAFHNPHASSAIPFMVQSKFHQWDLQRVRRLKGKPRRIQQTDAHPYPLTRLLPALLKETEPINVADLWSILVTHGEVNFLFSLECSTYSGILWALNAEIKSGNWAALLRDPLESSTTADTARASTVAQITFCHDAAAFQQLLPSAKFVQAISACADAYSWKPGCQRVISKAREIYNALDSIQAACASPPNGANPIDISTFIGVNDYTTFVRCMAEARDSLEAAREGCEAATATATATATGGNIGGDSPFLGQSAGSGDAARFSFATTDANNNAVNCDAGEIAASRPPPSPQQPTDEKENIRGNSTAAGGCSLSFLGPRIVENTAERPLPVSSLTTALIRADLIRAAEQAHLQRQVKQAQQKAQQAQQEIEEANRLKLKQEHEDAKEAAAAAAAEVAKPKVSAINRVTYTGSWHAKGLPLPRQNLGYIHYTECDISKGSYSSSSSSDSSCCSPPQITLPHREVLTKVITVEKKGRKISAAFPQQQENVPPQANVCPQATAVLAKGVDRAQALKPALQRRPGRLAPVPSSQPLGPTRRVAFAEVNAPNRVAMSQRIEEISPFVDAAQERKAAKGLRKEPAKSGTHAVVTMAEAPLPRAASTCKGAALDLVIDPVELMQQRWMGCSSGKALSGTGAKSTKKKVKGCLKGMIKAVSSWFR